MADDTSLLFRIRAENSQAKATLADTRNAVSQLRSTFGSEMGQLQSASTSALSKVTQSLTQVSSQLPIVGGTVGNLTSQFSSLSTTATTSAGSVGLVAGAAVVAASALGSLLKTVFDITIQAAEFQGKMFDLSQSTGVSVETLSTLEIVAKTTGGSIEGINASLGIFQKHLEEAQDSTSKQAALFRQLGVETNNTEDAFRQSLAVLARMPEGFHQTATALELFGRGGKSILAILKEMDGDLLAAQEQFREMGILITTEAAKAADEFNDKLALLGFQVRSVTGIIGNEAMPTILTALNSISQAFQANQSVIAAWVRDTADAARGALVLAGAISTIGRQITGLSNLPVPGIIQFLGSVSGATGILTGLRSLGTPPIAPLNVPEVKAPAIALPAIPTLSEIAKRTGRTGTGTGGGTEDLERELGRQLEAFKRLASELGEVADLYDGIDTSTREYAVTQSIANGVLSKASQGLQEIALSAAKNIDAIRKQIAQNKELEEFQKRQNESIKEAQQGQRSYLDQANDFIESLEAQGRSLDGVERFWLRFNARLLDAINLSRQLPDLLERVGDAAAQVDLSGLPGLSDDEISRRAGAAGDAAAGLTPEQPLSQIIAAATEAEGAFAGLGQAMSGVLGLGVEAGQIFGDTLSGIFGNLAIAVGNAFKAFILLGSAGGSIRKFAAEVIASVAQMAITKAVWELAEGLAMLALNFFWPNPKYAQSAAAHFKAAAVYGAIGAVAAVAGRAVAGNEFQAGGGGGSSSGGGGSRDNRVMQEQKPIDVDRRASVQSQSVVQTLEFRVRGDAVVQEWERDYMLNGRTRLVIKNDG